MLRRPQTRYDNSQISTQFIIYSEKSANLMSICFFLCDFRRRHVQWFGTRRWLLQRRRRGRHVGTTLAKRLGGQRGGANLAHLAEEQAQARRAEEAAGAVHGSAQEAPEVRADRGLGLHGTLNPRRGVAPGQLAQSLSPVEFELVQERGPPSSTTETLCRRRRRENGAKVERRGGFVPTIRAEATQTRGEDPAGGAVEAARVESPSCVADTRPTTARQASSAEIRAAASSGSDAFRAATAGGAAVAGAEGRGAEGAVSSVGERQLRAGALVVTRH